MQGPYQIRLDAQARPFKPATESPRGEVGTRGGHALRQATLGPVLVALAACLLGLFVLLRSFGFNPTALIFIGDAWGGQRFWTESTYLHHGFGYDGQFFYYLAHDPLLVQADRAVFGIEVYELCELETWRSHRNAAVATVLHSLTR